MWRLVGAYDQQRARVGAIMDPDISRLGFFFLGSCVLTLAVHAWSLGVRSAGKWLAVAGFGLLAGGYCSPQFQRTAWPIAAIWVGLFVVAAFAAFELRRQTFGRPDPRGVSRLPFIVFVSWSTAAFGLGAAVCVVLDAEGWLLFGLVCWWLCSWATLGISSLYIASNLETRGSERVVAARLYALSCLAVVLLPFVGLMGSREMAFAALVVSLALPFVGPFMALFLVGVGPVPRDLLHHSAPETAANVPRPTKRIGLAVWFAFALAAQTLMLLHHFGSCAGELATVTAPQSWRDLPIWKEDGDEHLGPFNFRAYHSNYKGYPSAYSNAALSDPGLCFASSVSLHSWFQDDMYRSPTELRLRKSTDGRTFFVSAKNMSDMPEQLIVAFERRLATHYWFDTDTSSFVFWLGVLLTGVGVGFALRWLRADGRGSGRAIALACFIGASTVVLLYESHWASDGTPKPGRELATEASFII